MNDSEELWKIFRTIDVKIYIEKINSFNKVTWLFQNSDLQLLQFDIQ